MNKEMDGTPLSVPKKDQLLFSSWEQWEGILHLYSNCKSEESQVTKLFAQTVWNV